MEKEIEGERETGTAAWSYSKEEKSNERGGNEMWRDTGEAQRGSLTCG